MNKDIKQIVQEVKDIVDKNVFVEVINYNDYRVDYEKEYDEALTNYFTNLLQSKKERNTPVGEERTNKYGDQMYFTGKKRIPFKGEWYMDDQDMVIQCNHFMDTAYEIYSFEKP